MKSQTGVRTGRVLAGALIIAALIAATAVYITTRAVQADVDSAARLDLARSTTMLVVDEAGRQVRQISRAEPARTLGAGPACYRAYAKAGTLICLRPATPMGFEAAVFNKDMRQVKVIALWGTPSRAQVSPTGRLVAWTVFHTGDSYLREGQFSTIAGIYNVATGEHYGSLEDFSAIVDGRVFTTVHINYWGITFADDDRTFYATMAAGDRTWLVRGDLASRTLHAIRDNVECPSLSPDGRRIAFKKRIGDRWRLHVLDLAGGGETPLAESEHVDDQPAWLDDSTIAYSRVVGSAPSIFTVAADGSGSAHLLRASASSPAGLA